MRTCTATFHFDEKVHKLRRQYVYNETVEYGGNSRINYDTKTIEPKDTNTSNQFAASTISDSRVDWHTHPAQCVKGLCTLGIPSAVDLENIFVLSLEGPIAHLVYSKEGTYLIRLNRAFIKRFRDDYDHNEFCSYICQLRTTFGDLYENFLHSKNKNYPSFRSNWLSAAQRLGFEIHFFQGDTVPDVQLVYPCDYKGTSSQTPSSLVFHDPKNYFKPSGCTKCKK